MEYGREYHTNVEPGYLSDAMKEMLIVQTVESAEEQGLVYVPGHEVVGVHRNRLSSGMNLATVTIKVEDI